MFYSALMQIISNFIAISDVHLSSFTGLKRLGVDQNPLVTFDKINSPNIRAPLPLSSSYSGREALQRLNHACSLGYLPRDAPIA
jgi:Leucine-rich repeat (LRR) protein